LRFNCLQNPEEILNERLQTIGLNSDYLKNEPVLFELFRQKLYKKLNRYYYELVDLIDSENFVWQIKIMWTVLKTKQSKKLNYEQIRKTIITPKLGEIFSEDGDLTLAQERQEAQSLTNLTKNKNHVEKKPNRSTKRKVGSCRPKNRPFRRKPYLI